MYLRKKTASQVVCFGLLNAGTGAALTGATVSVRRCLDGTFAAATGTVTEDTGTGFYKFVPSQADTNADQVSYFFTATSAVPVSLSMRTTAADPSDSVRFGLTALPNAAAAASGGLLISGSNSGTTTLGALSVTGTMTVSDGIVVTRSSSNQPGMSVTGNGTGNGINLVSGSGATGVGLRVSSNATNGNGASFVGAGTGHGAQFLSGTGATGDGISSQSLATNGNGFRGIGVGTGDGGHFSGGATGYGIHALGGATSGAGARFESQGANASALQLVSSGTGYGIDTDTINASGAVSLASTFTVTGATTFTGAVSATNGSNDIRGIGIATGGITSGSFAAGAINAAAIANGAIDAATFAADVDAEILSYLVDDATRMDASALNTLSTYSKLGVTGTVTTGATTTSIPTSSLSPAASVTDQFKGRVLIFNDDTTTAALRGQASDITANTAGGTLTVTALTTAPANGDTFRIV